MQDGSPAIDKGTDLRAQGMTTDFEGDPRRRSHRPATQAGEAKAVARARPAAGGPARLAEDGKARSVCVIPPGTNAHLEDSQVWYFRTAANQRMLELRVAQDSEGGVHIRTSDGSRLVAHMGSDGYHVGGSEGTLKAAVQPSTLYYMATSGTPNLTPIGYPLILSRTPVEWFEPEN